MTKSLLNFRKRQLGLWVVLPCLLMSFTLAKEEDFSKEPAPYMQIGTDSTKGYTINFNNVSIAEYLRFVSKTLNVNFVFNEADLQFNVTIVSEEPVNAKNVMATLIQVLRVNQLNLVEEGDTLLITSSKEVNQIPAVVSSDIPNSNKTHSPMVTRVFRIKNANITTLATILRPLVSTAALIEVSPETRQLIVTDITSNVEKIATLLTSLDAPHTPLDIDTYVATHISPHDLIPLVTKIVTPFAEGNPLILVPQTGTNSIFIVSTPHLIERTLAVMHDLDIAPQGNGAPIGQQTLFIYKIQTKTGHELLTGLSEFTHNLKKEPAPPTTLINALANVKWVKDSNSLIFSADEATLVKIKEILANLDGTPGDMQLSHGFFLYPLTHAKGSKVIDDLNKVAKHLSTSSFPNTNLIQAIHNVKWIEESNTLVLTGTTSSLEELKALVARFDSTGRGEKTSFYIYKPVNKPPKEVEKSLQELADDLESSGLADEDLLETVASVKHIPLTNSLLFTGTPSGLASLKEILTSLDVQGGDSTQVQHVGALTFLIYKIRYVPAVQLMASLNSFSADLQRTSSLDPELGQALSSMKWIKETNSLLFTGTQASLEKIENLVSRFDLADLAPKPLPIGNQGSFAIYKPHNRKGQDLITILYEFEQNLINSGVHDDALFTSINNLKWIDSTGSILISGDATSIAKVQELLMKFDTLKAGMDNQSIDSIDDTSFLVYKLQYHKGQEICDALKQLALQLGKNPTGVNKNLSEAINSIQWITVTNSLLVTGEQETLAKLRELINNLDIPLRQIFIEVLVLETTLGNTQAFGLQWGGKMQYLNKVALGTGNTPAPNPSTGTQSFGNNSGPFAVNGYNPLSGSVTPNATSAFPLPGSGFDLGVLGDIIMHKGKSFISLGSLVNALQTDADSTIVMNPKIITQDNNNSTIFVGQNIPYNSSLTQVSGQGTGLTQTTNIEYRDIGFNLSITPVVGNNDVVTLDISTDITSQLSVTGNSITNFSVNGIATTHTNMNTKVHVPSDNFLVLSGMLQDTKNHFKSGIPCLGGLPIIGAAFSENDRLDQKDNIIIFVRPHIINSYEDYRQLTERQEMLYKDEATLPVLKEQFDAGIDWVKTPENE